MIGPGPAGAGPDGTHLDDPASLFVALEPYRVLRTDRLHVGILGALMGKRVHLHEGAYFKNRAVFESSLAPNFPDVRCYARRRSSPRFISVRLFLRRRRSACLRFLA